MNEDPIQQTNETIILNDPLNVQIDRPFTEFETPEGTLHVIHEVSLGDLLISTLILCLIVFVVVARVVRR